MYLQSSLNKYKIFSLRFIIAYLITMRPYLMFVSGITGIVGMSFSDNLAFISGLIIFQVTFLSYGFGQALTDCFQIDTDSISSPYRPLTQGYVSRKHFLVLSCVGLIYCVAILSVYNSINLFLGIIAGLGLATYTTFKRKWWAGPFYNSCIVSVLFLMNLFASTTISFYEINLTIGLTLVAVFFGYSNFVLVGYFKDIEADEQTGYNTLPVVFGRKTSTMISNVFASFAVFATIMIFYITAAQTEFIQLIPAAAFLMAAVISTLYTQWQLRKVMYDEEAYKAVSPSVHSYLLTLSSITTMNKPSWSIFALLFYMVFIAVMKLRPTKTQI